MLLSYLVEERRATLNRLTALNAILAYLRQDQPTKAERERQAYEVRQAER